MTPQSIDKAQYDKLRDSFLNDERYLNASEEDKQKMLDNFYDKYTTSYLKGQGVEDQSEVDRLREVFKSKYGSQKKKEEPSEPYSVSAEELEATSNQQVPQETDTTVSPEDLEPEEKVSKQAAKTTGKAAGALVEETLKQQPEQISEEIEEVSELQAETPTPETDPSQKVLGPFKKDPVMYPTYGYDIPDFAPETSVVLPDFQGDNLKESLKNTFENLEKAREIYGEDFINTSDLSPSQKEILKVYIDTKQHAASMYGDLEKERTAEQMLQMIQHDPLLAKDLYKELGYKEPIEFAYQEMQDRTGGGLSRAYKDEEYLKDVPVQQAKHIGLLAYKKQAEMERNAKSLNETQMMAQRAGMKVDQFVDSEKIKIVDEITSKAGFELGIEYGTDPLEIVGRQYKAMVNMEEWVNKPDNTPGKEAKVKYYQAQISLLEKKRFEGINEQIKELRSERKEATSEKQRAIDKQIEYLEGLKIPVFNQDPVELASRVAAEQSSSSMGATLVDLINSNLDLNPKEKFDMWYYSLYQANKKLGQSIGLDDPNEIPISLSTADMLEWDTIDGIVGQGTFSTTEAEREWLKNQTMLKQLAPVFFTNKMQVSQNQGFASSFWNSYSQGVTPSVGAYTNPLEQVTAGEVVSQLTSMGFDQEEINQEAIESLVSRATPKALFGEGFSLFSPSTWDKFDLDAEKAGQTSGFLFHNMAVAYIGSAGFRAPIAKGLTKVSKSLDKLNGITTKYNNYLAKSPRITKYFANPLKEATQQGLVFEATGHVFTNQEDEFNFLSGFLGTFFGDVTKAGLNTAFTKIGSAEAFNRLNAMFGNKTPQAIAYLTDKGVSMASRGTGELVEETVQELTQIWRETENGKAFFNELETRFGTMSDIEEFIVVSFAMGSLYGMNDGNKYFQKQYKNLNSEQKQRVSKVLDEIATDAVGANAETIKEIQKDPFLASQLGFAPEIEGAKYVVDGQEMSAKDFHKKIHSEEFFQNAKEGNVNYSVGGDETALGVVQKVVKLAQKEEGLLSRIQSAKTETELNEVQDEIIYENLSTVDLTDEIAIQREKIQKGEVPMIDEVPVEAEIEETPVTETTEEASEEPTTEPVAEEVSPEIPAEQQAELDELTRDRDALPEGSRARAIIDQEIARIQEAAKPEKKVKSRVKMTKPLSQLRQELADLKKRKEAGSDDPGLDQQILEWEEEIAKQEELGVTEGRAGTEDEIEAEESVMPEEDDIVLKHGTPHDFDKFELEKIGTGEGNQAFGWGLYFTESNEIAKSYAKKLSKDKEGQIYSVKIKEGRQKQWMDWREPLDIEQEVSIVEKLRNENLEEQYNDWAENIEDVKNYHGIIDSILNNINKEGVVFEETSTPAGSIYRELADFLGEKKATEFMQEIGIDGVRYKSKRGIGDAYNYVVFDPNSIEIIDKTKIEKPTKEDVKPKTETEAPTTTEETPILERPPVQQKALEGNQRKWKGKYEDQPVLTAGKEREEYDIEGREMHYVEPTASEVESVNEKLKKDGYAEFTQKDNLIVDSTTGEVLGIGYANDDRSVFSRVFFDEFKKQPTKAAKVEKEVSDGEALAAQFNKLSKRKRQSAEGQDLMNRAVTALDEAGIEYTLKSNQQGTRIVYKDSGKIIKAKEQAEKVEGDFDTLATDKSGYSLVKTEDGEIVPVNKEGKVVRNYRHKERLVKQYKDELVKDAKNFEKYPPAESDLEWVGGKDYRVDLAQKTSNPADIARVYLEEVAESRMEEEAAELTLEGLVMGEGGGKPTPIPISNFDQEFDPNLRKGKEGKTIELNWLIADKNATKENSRTVDEWVMEVRSVAPQYSESQVRDAIVDMIQAYPSGPRSYVPEWKQATIDIENEFKAKFGFDIDQDFARKLVSAEFAEAKKRISPEEANNILAADFEIQKQHVELYQELENQLYEYEAQRRGINSTGESVLETQKAGESQIAPRQRTGPERKVVSKLGKGSAGGRPGVIYANKEYLPVPEERVSEGQYEIDEDQRFAVNLALERFQTGGKAFVLADGTGVGKTRQILATADAFTKETGEDVLIITENQTIIDTGFAKDAEAMGIDLSKMEVGTYNSLRDGKVGGKKYGLVIYDEAHNLKNATSGKSIAAANVDTEHNMYVTATPMDTLSGAVYFISETTGLTEDEVFNQLGLDVTFAVNEQTGLQEKRVRMREGVNHGVLNQNLIKMREGMMRDGAMIRREYPFYGTLGDTTIPLNQDQAAIQDDIEAYWEAQKEGATFGQRKAIGGARSRELNHVNEFAKVQYVFQKAKEDVAAGKKVVIIAETINPSFMKSLDKEVPGFIGTIEKMFADEGYNVAKIYGKNNKSKAQEQFQSGEADIVIGTARSASTGIDLDDQVGGKPRKLYMVSANFSGNVFQQILGRVSRRNTKSEAEVEVLYTPSVIDARRNEVVTGKLNTLKAIQDGEIGDGEVEMDILIDADKVTTDNKGPIAANLISEKAFVIEGEGTRGIKDRLKKMGAKWNRKAQGWMFPVSKADKIAKEFGVDVSSAANNVDKMRMLSEALGKMKREEKAPQDMTAEEFAAYSKKQSQENKKDLDNFLKGIGEYKQSKKDQKKEGDDETGKIMANINPLLIAKWGWDQTQVLQEKTFGKAVDVAEDYISKKVREGITSQYWAKRRLSNTLTNWFNGLPRTKSDVSSKLNLSGQKSFAKQKAVDLMTDLRKIANNNVEALKRVDQALDPDFYFKAGEEPVTYDELSKEEKELYKTIRGIYDRIHDWNYDMGLIDDATYQKHYGTYTGRDYDVFELPRELIEALESGSNAVITEALSNFENTAMASTLGPMMLNIYKARKEVDEWMAEHKVKDPTYVVANRLMQTEVNAAILEYANHIFTNNSELVSDEEKPGFVHLKGGGEFGNSKIWGPLTDKYIANHLYEDFTTYRYSNEAMNVVYDILKIYDKTKYRQFLKKYHTVYSPAVQLGNYFSNFVFAWLSGIDPLTFMANRVKATKIYKSKSGVYGFIAQSGILGADVLSGDFMPMSDKLNEAKDFMDQQNKSTAQRRLDAIKKGLISADEWSTEKYRANDDIAKIAAYLSFKDRGMSDEQALEKVYEGFQNYATVGKIWDFASKIPIFGKTYVKFQADLLRILKNAGLKKPLTMAGYVMAVKALTLAASKHWSDEDEIERKIREGRSFIPKIPNPFGEDVSLVVQTPYGEFNIARYASPFYIYDMGDMENTSEFLWKFAPIEFYDMRGYEKGTTLPFVPRGGDVMLGPIYEAFVVDRDFRNRSVQDPTATRWKASGNTRKERMINALNYVARSHVPFFSTTQDVYLSETTGRDFYNRNKSILDNFISKFIKVEQIKGTKYEEIADQEIERLMYRLSENKGIATDVKRQAQKAYNKNVEDFESGEINKAQYQRNQLKVQEDVERRLAPLLEKKAEIIEKLDKWVDLYKELTGENPF